MESPKGIILMTASEDGTEVARLPQTIRNAVISFKLFLTMLSFLLASSIPSHYRIGFLFTPKMLK
jgi:hypothetical protein